MSCAGCYRKVSPMPLLEAYVLIGAVWLACSAAFFVLAAIAADRKVVTSVEPAIVSRPLLHPEAEVTIAAAALLGKPAVLQVARNDESDQPLANAA